MNTVTLLPDHDTIRGHVRERYGAIARQSDAAPTDSSCGCTASGCCGGPVGATNGAGGSEPTYGEKLGYSAEELAAAADGDLGLGCGNPLAIASIRSGETVLDLGSGAGFDCLLAARQLKGTGRVIGVDMTHEMIARARANAARAGHANLEFRLGEIEALPVADATVDLIISNCVVNLSPEKERVIRESFRVLKPGGRLAIADIVATQPLPAELRTKLAAIGACVAGAALVDDLQAMLKSAGFSRVDIALRESSRAMIREWTKDPAAGNFVVSALITAYKPGI
jgi:arsenite methyltransferase